MDKIQALANFWKSFNIPAYDESTVPDNAQMPYITFQVSVGEFGDDVASSVSVWYYSQGWKTIEQKVKQIEEKLKNGGVQIPYDEGTIWIKPSLPFLQRVEDSNDMVRRYLINTFVEYH